MRVLALIAAALAFPCMLILASVVVALRRQVPRVSFRTIWVFLGLGVVMILLHGVSSWFWKPLFFGRVGYGFYGAFVEAAIPEEGLRYLVIRWALARRPVTNLVTSMLLGSIVGLTFGAYEHCDYLWSSGWLVWLARSFTSVPYHTLAGAILGYCAAIAIRTRRPWGIAGLAFMVLVHGLGNWSFLDTTVDEQPITFVTSGWAGNVAAFAVAAVLAAVLYRNARKTDAARAEPSDARKSPVGRKFES